MIADHDKLFCEKRLMDRVRRAKLARASNTADNTPKKCLIEIMSEIFTLPVEVCEKFWLVGKGTLVNLRLCRKEESRGGCSWYILVMKILSDYVTSQYDWKNLCHFLSSAFFYQMPLTRVMCIPMKTSMRHSTNYRRSNISLGGVVRELGLIDEVAGEWSEIMRQGSKLNFLKAFLVLLSFKNNKFKL